MEDIGDAIPRMIESADSFDFLVPVKFGEGEKPRQKVWLPPLNTPLLSECRLVSLSVSEKRSEMRRWFDEKNSSPPSEYRQLPSELSPSEPGKRLGASLTTKHTPQQKHRVSKKKKSKGRKKKR